MTGFQANAHAAKDDWLIRKEKYEQYCLPTSVNLNSAFIGYHTSTIGHIETFYGSFWDECLNLHWFVTLDVVFLFFVAWCWVFFVCCFFLFFFVLLFFVFLCL